MGAKRVLLMIGGTVGGLGAVLSITPPQFGSASSGTLGKSVPVATVPAASNTAATPAASPATVPAATATTAATAAIPVPAPVKSKPTGTFTGATQQTQYGPVQVQIKISNGKITAAKALQIPDADFRSKSISEQAVPLLVQETLAANSSNIQGVGGASYTSQGWYDSLVSALAKAGM